MNKKILILFYFISFTNKSKMNLRGSKIFFKNMFFGKHLTSYWDYEYSSRHEIHRMDFDKVF